MPFPRISALQELQHFSPQVKVVFLLFYVFTVTLPTINSFSVTKMEKHIHHFKSLQKWPVNKEKAFKIFQHRTGVRYFHK